MISYFEVPYLHTEKPGHPIRRLVLNDLRQEINECGGYWEEAEIEGDKALVRVRATQAVMNLIKNNLPVTPISDPLHVWTPTRVKAINRGGEIAFDSGQIHHTKTIEQLQMDVLTDEESDDVKRFVEQTIPTIEENGYVRLISTPWPHAAKLLSHFSALGFGLNRISTGTFPTTGILDNFNRADEGPPPSASWDWPVLGVNGAGVISNRMGGTAGTPGGRLAYWKTPFGPNCEVYFTVGVLPPDGSDFDIMLRGQSFGAAGVENTSADAYISEWAYSAAGTDTLSVYRADNNVWTLLGAAINAEGMAVGLKQGFEIIGTTMQNYWDTGSGWASVGTTRTDSTYQSAGFLAAGHGSTTARLDDVGGGTIVTAGSAILTSRKIVGATRP
jgi:hypothetical protein